MSNNNFKKSPRDGDKDGLLQEGTDFERPAKIKGEEKVAIYSPRNIFWQEVGRIHKGYNIVTPGKAEKWLTLDGIRVASPEEVAREYGL